MPWLVATIMLSGILSRRAYEVEDHFLDALFSSIKLPKWAVRVIAALFWILPAVVLVLSIYLIYSSICFVIDVHTQNSRLHDALTAQKQALRELSRAPAQLDTLKPTDFYLSVPYRSAPSAIDDMPVQFSPYLLRRKLTP